MVISGSLFFTGNVKLLIMQMFISQDTDHKQSFSHLCHHLIHMWHSSYFCNTARDKCIILGCREVPKTYLWRLKNWQLSIKLELGRIERWKVRRKTELEKWRVDILTPNCMHILNFKEYNKIIGNGKCMYTIIILQGILCSICLY